MSDETVQRIDNMETIDDDETVKMKTMMTMMITMMPKIMMTNLLRSGWFHSTPSSRIVTVTPFPL